MKTLIAAAAMFVVACGSAPRTAEDGSVPGACTPGCPTGQVCNAGTCVALPAHCPCPTGAYCNLADNTCHVGCVSDPECGSDQICDDTHQCRAGCRVDTDCTGSTCATASCDMTTWTCDVTNIPDGTSCAMDSDPCSQHACSAGACVLTVMPDGTSCGSTSNPCVTNACSAGACVHTTAPDYTPCHPAEGPPAVLAQACVGGACKAAKESCWDIPIDTFASMYAEPAGTIDADGASCGCSGTELVLDTDALVVPCTACGEYMTSGGEYYVYCL